jgi:2-dehydro-3-deoxygluconokinase
VFTAAAVGPTRVGDGYRFGLGGAECNVAVGCARLGVSSAVVGVVGDDPLGAALVRALRADGVGTDAVHVAPGYTGVMVKEVRSAGRVRIAYARSGSAGSQLSPAHLQGAPLDDARVLHTAGVTASFGAAARQAVQEAAATVRAGGGIVSFDLNYRERLWPDAATAAAVLRSFVADADVVFLGDSEARLLLGEDPAGASPYQVLDTIAALGPSQVVLKAGGTVHARVDGDVVAAAAPPMAVVVDPVGAGDAFAAGYLTALLAGEDAEGRLRRAVELGRWAVSTAGDSDGLPYADELGDLDGDDVRR